MGEMNDTWYYSDMEEKAADRAEEWLIYRDSMFSTYDGGGVKHKCGTYMFEARRGTKTWVCGNCGGVEVPTMIRWLATLLLGNDYNG